MKIAEQERPEEVAWIPRLLAGLAGFSGRFPVPVLAVGLGLIVLSLWAAYTHLEYRTSRHDLINPNKDCQQRWHGYLAEFGSDEDIVVLVEGTDRARLRQALEAVAHEVRQRSDLFDRLFFQVDLRALRNRALLYLTADEIRSLRDQLSAMAPLLELGPLGWRGLTLANLVQDASRRADGPGFAADERFWRQLLAVSQSAETTLGDATAFRNPWSGMIPQRSAQPDLLAEPQFFFSEDGSLAFLLVRPVMEEGSFTAARQSVETIRGGLARVREQFPDLRFGLTGLPVLETDEMVATQEDTTRAGWLALAGVALLYLVVYRSLRYPLLTVVTLLTGTIWALGWLTWTVGHLNILSATFAIMLIGMGDYGILWVTRYEQERQSGADSETATRATARGVGPSILTAAVTTALAFYAAMLADFQAVLELGWIAGSGVLLCALACFTVLPALLAVTQRRSQLSRGFPPSERPAWCRSCGPHDRHQAGRSLGGKPRLSCERQDCSGVWLPFFTRHPRGVMSAGLALTALLSCGVFALSYDHNLLHMQAHGLESVQWELKLIERTAGASWHALSYRASRDEVLELKARYEQLPTVSRVVEVASLIPDDQELKLELLRDIQHQLRWLPERGTTFSPLATDLTNLRATLRVLVPKLLSAPESSPLLAEVGQGLRTLASRIEALPTEPGTRRLLEFDRRLASGLAENLHDLREAAQPAPIQLEDLPIALRERHVSPRGQWLLRVFARECLWDFEPLNRFVQQVRTVDPHATGKPFTTREGLGAMKSGFQWAALYALSAIVFVLLLDFRSVKYTLLALAPLAMGVLASLGVMGLFGIPLNPANMIAFPLILGVGVDNGVHVLHDYLARRSGQPYTLSRTTGRGILVAALTTVLGFGTLMVAQHRGQVGLGFTLSLGVTCCMLASLVFLPALLRLLSARKERTVAPASEVAPLRRAA